MSDLYIPAASVAADTKTSKGYGISAGAITAGQVVWLDTGLSPNLLRLAQATSLVQAANVVGVALDSAAGPNQAIAYATGGNVILPGTVAGSSLVPGSVYVLSTNPGGIAPSTDPGTATFITVLGIATSATTLQLGINPVAAPR